MSSTTRHFHAPDGLRLAYHLVGEGHPLVCLPGGPMLDAGYLGDLGGLSAHRRLVLLDNRGSGSSGTPQDHTSYRCDRLVGDLESLRVHLGLERLDLLAHSGGANLAYRYCERHPDRVARLVLVTPSVRALGIEVSADARREMAATRTEEPWYAEAAASFERIQSGDADDDDWEAIAAFAHGTWDDDARAYDAEMDARRNETAAEEFGAEGAFDPDATRAALSTLAAPVLVVAGGRDIAAPPRVLETVAGLFAAARLVVQPGAGHFPWRDDPVRLTAAISGFLNDSTTTPAESG